MNSAHAWKESGGGDSTGMSFKQSFSTAMKTLLRAHALSPFDYNRILSYADSVRVISTDETLNAEANESYQSSVALNDRAKNLITVNRAGWKAITDPRVREAIALHEVLSVIGIESTGIYTYSGKYKEIAAGAPPEDLNIPSGPRSRAKTLSCVISYSPPGGGAPIDQKFEGITAPDPKGREQLSRQNDYTTPDGRFSVHVWGVQPDITPSQPHPFEYVGVEIDDTKLDTYTVGGSNGGFNLSKDEDHVNVTHLFGLKDLSGKTTGSVSAEFLLN